MRRIRAYRSSHWIIGMALVAALLTAPPPTHSGAAGVAVPPVGAGWQYQLQADAGARFSNSGGINVALCERPIFGTTCQRAKVFSIDLYGPSGATPNASGVRAIRSAGGYAICYVDAGTWESWRPDAAAFPKSLLGRSNGWPGERWLDIRRTRVLLSIMARRVALCQRAGFQAVDFDNVDAYDNTTGFAITAADQITYDRALAALAHRDHMAVGLKNDGGQARVLVRYFDFAIDEQCVQYHSCAQLDPFLRAGKPVYDVEYVGSALSDCRAAPPGIDVINKALSLNALPWRPCR
ncbi:MAG: endo alpha-1,4 polygalactosaminidase [Acidimicrobiales bacterium]